MATNSPGKSQDKDQQDKSRLEKFAYFGVWFFILMLVILLLAELGMPWLEAQVRVSNQSLILLIFLIITLLFISNARIIRNVTLKIYGQEVQLGMQEVKEEVKSQVDTVENKLGIQISNAEQALWPMLAGNDLHNAARLKEGKLVIGSKLDSSHIYFGYLLKLCVEKFIPGSQCEVIFPNGGSMKNFADIQHHWIDMYIDSSGTVCQYFNISHHGKTEPEIHTELNLFGEALGLKWLEPLGASEDYCLVMSPQRAKEVQVESIRDLLSKGPELIFSGDPEFLNRRDCYLGLRKYGVEFKQVKPCRILHRYKAMKSGEADVFVGYETDPQIISGEAIRLKDPDNFFPRYLAIPTVSLQALHFVQGLEEAINKLHNSISTRDLITAVNKLIKHDNDKDIARGLAMKVVDNIA